MSLQLTAKHLAAHGRGPDTTLVHMAPKEVASLQDLAQQHGGSLTINPHTGLPEAGFLESLLPMALGAGAMMLPGMQGVGAGWIGAGLGAIEGLRTGSLKQGLMAGLGAYGGASMAGGLLGSGAMQGIEGGKDQMALLQQQQAIAADKATPILARQAAEQQAAELSKQIAQRQAEALANQSSKSFMENLSSNFSKAGSGLTGGFGNFSNSVGMVPGSIGLKTALGAAAIPAVMGAYEDSKEGVPAQKTNDADLGAYAKSGAQFHPNWVGPYESRVPGGEYTYARPYYGAEGGAVGMADGGVTGMAMGGIPQRDVYQEYMDYYNNSFPPVSKETVTTPLFKYPEPTVAAPAPAPATPFLEAPISNNTQGGRGMSQEQRDEKNDPNSWSNQTDSQKARQYAYSPIQSQITQLGLEGLKSPISSMGLLGRLFGGDTFVKNIDKNIDIAKGYDPANVAPVMEGYTRVSPTDPFRRTVKEQDTYSNENSNAKIAGIIANAEAALRQSANEGDAGNQQAANAMAAQAAASRQPSVVRGDPAQQKAAIAGMVAASNAAANGVYGNSANSGPANDGRADPGGEGKTSYGAVARGYTGGSEAATGGLSTLHGFEHMARGGNVHGNMRPPPAFFQNGKFTTHPAKMYAEGGVSDPYNLGSYSDGGRLLKGPGDGVSDSIPATIGKGQPARLADGEFVIPARIVSEIGNGSTEAGARKLYAMMDRIQAGRKKSVGRGKVAVNSRADRYLPA